MMTPDQINGLTLTALRAAREGMMSAEWSLEMDAAAPDLRRRSGLLLGMVQGEILRLENAQLATIANALAANGAALRDAASGVERELKQIARVAKVLKAVDQLVKLAIRIVPKAMGLMGAARRAPAPGSILARRLAAPAAARARTKTKTKTKTKPAVKASKPKPKPKPKSKAAPKRASRATSKAGVAARRKAGPRRRAR